MIRVQDKQGEELSEEKIQKVVAQALAWRDVEYVEPPISLTGDPKETGLYCSMLPYRAFLDAIGIDLDASWSGRSISIPFFITPDELYEAKQAKVVFESAPEDPPTR